MNDDISGGEKRTGIQRFHFPVGMGGIGSCPFLGVLAQMLLYSQKVKSLKNYIFNRHKFNSEFNLV